MAVLDMFSLAGKVSVVTGANRGIGRALTTALAEAGSDLVLLVRSAAAGAEVKAEVESLGVRAEVVTADVTNLEQLSQAAADAVQAFGHVDVLVNNAGTCIHKPALEVTPEDWRQV